MPPTGNMLEDGHSCKIELSGAPNAPLWEKEVTPPGLDGRGPNDVTTMRNVTYTTKAPKKLKDIPECSFTAGFASNSRSVLLAQVNVNQLITFTYPDGGTDAVWGYLNEFKINALKEGEMPTASCSIVVTNRNASGVETPPVYTAPPSPPPPP